jgi:hypothetical protein
MSPRMDGFFPGEMALKYTVTQAAVPTAALLYSHANENKSEVREKVVKTQLVGDAQVVCWNYYCDVVANTSWRNVNFTIDFSF